MTRPRPLFPKAWEHYNVVVATISAILVFLNAVLIEIDDQVNQAWVGAAISLLGAALIWINDRRKKLGLNGNGNGGRHAQQNEPDDKPPSG